MDPALQQESEKLARSWDQHDPAWLNRYLVTGVEDPRLNLQSIFSRHFLLGRLAPGDFLRLMHEEHRFAAAMNCLVRLIGSLADREEMDLVLYALHRGADNVEGIQLPQYLLQIFSTLPAVADGVTVPNYIETFLTPALPGTQGPAGAAASPALDLFTGIWSKVLATQAYSKISVLEPACGSANDYRFLHACGLARWLDYTGIDLCEHNIRNARATFPQADFQTGNVFELKAADASFNACYVHDLFEHLSLEGLAVAVGEVCRVTRSAICAGFFQMHELPEHTVRLQEDYHLNTLSLARVRELFAARGFQTQAINVGEFLKRQVGCDETHNPNAYTLFLTRT